MAYVKKQYASSAKIINTQTSIQTYTMPTGQVEIIDEVETPIIETRHKANITFEYAVYDSVGMELTRGYRTFILQDGTSPITNTDVVILVNAQLLTLFSTTIADAVGTDTLETVQTREVLDILPALSPASLNEIKNAVDALLLP